MNNLTQFSVIASPGQALNKLSRENIPVYGCEKRGAYFLFSVRDNYVKKVFAIFAHPCYNVAVRRKSAKKRLAAFVFGRAFLIAGCILFAACAYLSDKFVFRISVTGSGAYLENEVKGIVYSLGVRENSYYKGIDEPALISQVLALPSVTFCSVKKSGSILYIDVECEEESADRANYSSLTADRDGTVEKVVAICGTAVAAAGEQVKKGDCLIAAYTTVNEQQISCLAVGYAVLSCSATVSSFAEEESEENLEKAYAAALLYADGGEITSRTCSVTTNSEGVIYVVQFTYLHTLSINFD